jgi:hypothetical protein
VQAISTKLSSLGSETVSKSFQKVTTRIKIFFLALAIVNQKDSEH